MPEEIYFDYNNNSDLNCKVCLAPAYPSSSTPPFDFSTFYPPTPSANSPYSSSSLLLSDSTGYYSNSYYPSPSPYYFPYGTPSSSSSSAHYPFLTALNYPLNNNYSNLDAASFLQMQPPMTAASTDYTHVTPSLPISTDAEQY